MDPNVPDVALREAAFAAVAQEDLAVAVDQVDHLVRPPEDIYTKNYAIVFVESALSCRAFYERRVSARPLPVSLFWRLWSIFAK